MLGFEDRMGGCASKYVSAVGWFCLRRYLTIEYTEEICGQFGSDRWINFAHIALLERDLDDVVSASLFVGFR